MFTCAAKVDIGVFEAQNDDRILLGQNIVTDGIVSTKITDDYLLGAVCDGVGGLAKGYAAAELTLRFMSFIHRKGTDAETIRNAIEEANRRVLAFQKENGISDGARTTISGFFSQGDNLWTFNAGDSRVYKFRYKYITQLTKDNSYVQDLIDLGEITEDEARKHPKRNLINKCLGNSEIVEPKITLYHDEFEEGDILLACSDGISDAVTNKELQSILADHKDDEDMVSCCEAVYKQAIENGSLDNLSVLIARKEMVPNG